jgi:hypothetical protein
LILPTCRRIRFLPVTTLDTIDGTVYVQIILNGWNSYIKIDPQVAINENATHFRTVAKFGAGVSGFELSQIKTFLKLVNPDWAELAAAANNSYDTLTNYQELAKIDSVGYIQVIGQKLLAGLLLQVIPCGCEWLLKLIPGYFDPDAYDPDLLPEGMACGADVSIIADYSE